MMRVLLRVPCSAPDFYEKYFMTEEQGRSRNISLFFNGNKKGRDDL